MSDRLYRRKPRGTWYGWINLASGKRITICTRTSDKRTAKKVLREAERKALLEEFSASRQKPKTKSGYTFAEALQRLLDIGCLDLSPGTVDMYRKKSGHLARLLGHVDVAQLDRPRMQRYIDARLREHAHPSSIYKELVTARRALRLCFDRGEIDLEPTAIVPRFRNRYRPRDRWLPPAELAALLAELPEHRHLWVLLAVYTGARHSEVEALTWRRHIDLDSGWILLPGTKTARSRRWVPIAKPLRTALRRAQQSRGTVVQRWTNVRRDLHAACERADIDPCSPNDLRRTHASWLKQQGVDSLVVARLLGHTSTRMIEQVYGQLADPVYQEAISLLPAPGAKRKRGHGRSPGSKWVAETCANMGRMGRSARGSKTSRSSKRGPMASKSRCPETESNCRHGDFQSFFFPMIPEGWEEWDTKVGHVNRACGRSSTTRRRKVPLPPTIPGQGNAARLVSGVWIKQPGLHIPALLVPGLGEIQLEHRVAMIDKLVGAGFKLVHIACGAY